MKVKITEGPLVKEVRKKCYLYIKDTYILEKSQVKEVKI